MTILDDLYYKCVQLVLVIMLISITITPVVSSDKHLICLFLSLELHNLLPTAQFLYTFYVYLVVFQSTFNKFCLHAVAELATHYANRHGVLHARYTVVQRHYVQVYPANFLLCYVKFLTL